MQRRVFLFVALVLCLPAMALASTITAPTNFALNGGVQVVNLLISGTDIYADTSFNGTIDAGGPVVTLILGKPNVAGALAVGDLAGTVWAGGSGGIVAGTTGLNPQTGLSAAGSAATVGTYLILTINSAGVAPGTYNFDMSATELRNGVDQDLEPIIVPLDFVGGSFTMAGIPEPSSVVLGLFAVAGLAAVAIRRRRTA